MKNVLIINYGMGNIGSVANALDCLGGKYSISNNKEDLLNADAFILPGVGAFGSAMENLKKMDLIDILKQAVVENKKPFLGICLGMQLLAEDSLEQGFHKGLGWIQGHVVPLTPEGPLRVPHVGWNNAEIIKREPLFLNIDEDASFYHDHCYHMLCDKELVASTFDYGGKFVSSIHNDNIYATQFHPEKSQRSGLKLLRNFLNLVESRS